MTCHALKERSAKKGKEQKKIVGIGGKKSDCSDANDRKQVIHEWACQYA